MRAAALVLVGVLTLLAAPTKTTAQVSGVAMAALTPGNLGDGFFGPWRGTPTGIEISYSVLCYDTLSRDKAVRGVVAAILDGSSLAEIRILSTTAIVAGCAEYGITVPRGAVLLPAIQLGL